jgi:spore coat polysaccharide biosynthesis protein SpsF
VILAILQARMSSTRLPGKVLMPLAGAPLVLRQIERLRRARHIDELLVATSTDPSDDQLAETLDGAEVPVFRGDLQDVLGRYNGALLTHPDALHVVRLTADCPLTDPALIDQVIEEHVRTGADYTSNTPEPRTYPKGLDCEIMRSDVLRAAAAEAVDKDEREHVTMFIYRRPDRFRIAGVSQGADEGDVRWTVDRPDDYQFVSAVYDALYPTTPTFDSPRIRAFVASRPDLQTLGGDRRI